MQQVPNPPPLPKPPSGFSPIALATWTGDLTRTLWRYFLDVSRRLNASITTDEIGAGTSIAGTPKYIGQFAFVGGDAYISVGTSSSADWKKITP